jgi:hypothetical protein
MTDEINEPSHYQSRYGIESIELIRDVVCEGKTPYQAFLAGCATKYLFRAGRKGDALDAARDCRKAARYCALLAAEYETALVCGDGDLTDLKVMGARRASIDEAMGSVARGEDR